MVRHKITVLGTFSDQNFEIWCILTVSNWQKTVSTSDTKCSLSNEHPAMLLPSCYSHGCHMTAQQTAIGQRTYVT